MFSGDGGLGIFEWNICVLKRIRQINVTNILSLLKTLFIVKGSLI